MPRARRKTVEGTQRIKAARSCLRTRAYWRGDRPERIQRVKAELRELARG